MLKLLVTSSVIAVVAAVSGFGSIGYTARCLPPHAAQTASPTGAATSRPERNPEADSSARLIESLCIIMRRP
jgi:hypothetical protein